MIIERAFHQFLSLNYQYRRETFDLMKKDGYLLFTDFSDWIINFIPENVNSILNLINDI